MTDPVHGGDAERWGGWTWSKPARGEHFRRCSYCGSVSPEDLAAEPAWRAEWADRKYGWPHKFYVDIPNRKPDELFVIGSHFGGPADAPPPRSAPGGMQWVAWKDLTRAQRKIVKRDGMGDRGNPPRYVAFGTRPSHFGKFYTVHLADPAISTEVMEAIQQRSGLRFTFADGRVQWQAWQ